MANPIAVQDPENNTLTGVTKKAITMAQRKHRKNATTQGKNDSCWKSTGEVFKIEACALLHTEVTLCEPFDKNVAN